MSSPSDLANSVQALATTLLSSVTDPNDAIRIFTQLNNFSVTSSPSPTAQQISVQGGVQDLCRRTAVIALAQASSSYQPVSQNDAQNLQNIVCGLLDKEITIAGDQGQDETFLSLTNLRIAVVTDLTTRGSTLPTLRTFSNNNTMPALTLAYKYYQDINRTDQLIGFANPIHPAFMPISFQALSS